MKLELGGGAVLALAAVGLVGLVWFKRGAIGAAVASAGQAINPTSRENLAYRGSNAIGAAVSGDAGFTLGSWLYDRFNEPPDLSVPAPRPTSGDFARMDRASGTYDGLPEVPRYSPGEWDFGGTFGYGAP